MEQIRILYKWNTKGWTYPLVWWFSNVRSSLPVSASQSLTDRSPEAETMNDSDIETALTAALWAPNTNWNSRSGNEYVLTVRSGDEKKD